MTNAQDLKKGDEVSWKWGSGHPSGKVVDVVEGEAEATTKRGKTITKQGDKDDPAVVVTTNSSGSEGIKKASELDGVKP